MTNDDALRIALDAIQHRMRVWAFDANVATFDINAPPSAQKALDNYKRHAQALLVIEGMLKQKRMEI